MRSKLLLLALVLAFADQALAQPPLPAGTPAAPAAGPGAAPPGAPGSDARPSAMPPAMPGVVTLSDVARQAPTAAPPIATPLPVAPVQSDVRLPEEGLPRGIPVALAPRPLMSIILSRISTVGADTSAVLWIKGRHRKVAPGERVLQYTVGEIRAEGVCLYQARSDGKVKDRCQEMVTFVQGL